MIWDAVVVGAGPAGSLAARGLALKGASVLLADKAVFPRPKVCGCCLNPAALEALSRAGLAGLVERIGAKPLHRIRIASGGREASVRLPGRQVVSRQALDAALVEAAREAGVRFMPGTAAQLGEPGAGVRRVILRQGNERSVVEARILLAADGLSGNFLSGQTDWKPEVAPGSRIGAGAVLGEPGDFYEAETIHMACGSGGYAGLVRLEDGRLNVAAALSFQEVRDAGPAGVVKRILREAGFPEPLGLDAAAWSGTPPMTRRRKWAARDRVFLLGDAAGYAEPFTGEGIGWAMDSGLQVVPLALEGIREWSRALEVLWARARRPLLRQAASRLLSGLLRHPGAARTAFRLLELRPFLGERIVKQIDTMSGMATQRWTY